MKCPTCGNEMDLLKQDTTRSRLQNKTYDRAIYACPSDETWVTVEVLQAATIDEQQALPANLLASGHD